MISVEYRYPTRQDLLYLSKNLRAVDVAEIQASSGLDVLDALEYALEYSINTQLAVYNGEPVYIYGLSVGCLLDEEAIIWMLGTDKVDFHKKSMMKNSRKFIKESLYRFYKLYNYVHFENKKAINYLQHLGFVLDEPKPFGKNGELFCRFEKCVIL